MLMCKAGGEREVGREREKEREIILKKNALAACKSTLKTANTRMIM